MIRRHKYSSACCVNRWVYKKKKRKRWHVRGALQILSNTQFSCRQPPCGFINRILVILRRLQGEIDQDRIIDVCFFFLFVYASFEINSCLPHFSNII